MSLSEEPGRKLFISQCCHLVVDNNFESITNQKRWIYTHKKSFSVGLIWLQGVIVDVSKLEDKISIDDGSGIANVCSVSEVPGFGSWIAKGCYVMIIGELLFNTPNVNIRALKVAQLKEVDEETSWMLEVLDFSEFMANT